MQFILKRFQTFALGWSLISLAFHQPEQHVLKYYLSEFDSKISDIEVIHGPPRLGDVPHSLASIEKTEGSGQELEYFATILISSGIWLPVTKF